MGYRIDKGNGIAKGNDPETLYAVMGGKHYNGGCCFGASERASESTPAQAASLLQVADCWLSVPF